MIAFVAPKFPVTVILEAVVEARVDEDKVCRLVTIEVEAYSVFENVVVALVVEAFRVAKFAVDPKIVPITELVMFAKVATKPGVVVVATTEKLVTAKLVIVALLRVALVAFNAELTNSPKIALVE
jgi:hypothetical protein